MKFSDIDFLCCHEREANWKLRITKLRTFKLFFPSKGPSPLASWLAGVTDAFCKIECSDKAKMEKNIQNFHCFNAMSVGFWGFKQSWEDESISKCLDQFLCYIFLIPSTASGWDQHTSGCISMHQGACIRPSTYQHASLSHFFSNVFSIGLYGGDPGWSRVCSKEEPLQTAKEAGCYSVLYLVREHRYRQWLRWKAKCGPLLTRLGDVTTAVVCGRLGGRGMWSCRFYKCIYAEDPG